jgi:hypothetical protein
MEPKHILIYVTIGIPFSRTPIAQKVMLYVDLDGGGTSLQAAEEYRRFVGDNIEMHGWVSGTNFNPSDLYYEIFYDVDNTIPIAASPNSPYYKKST